MSRFEDQFKNAFDHFEPEVDPKLWQQISQQLPSGPQNPGAQGAAGSAGKGILAQLGIKGVAAILTSTTLTILGVNYLLNKDDNAAQKNVPAIVNEQTIAAENAVETTLPSTQENTPIASEVNTTPSENPSEQKAIDSQKENKNNIGSKITIENALTGDFSKGQGESTIDKGSPSPVSTVKNSVATSTKQSSNTTVGETKVIPEIVKNTENKVKPVLILSATQGFAPLSITALTNQVGTVNALFSFGDGKSSLPGSTANVTYEEPGVYTVTCDINEVKLEQKVTVFGKVPSAFSPNGDGINDLLMISKEEGITVEIKIFNRYGKLMFTGKGNNISWDGTFEGRNADAGTYLYDIFATSDEGKTFKQKGTIHLFR
jgi:gliding motility-associated-like protein